MNSCKPLDTVAFIASATVILIGENNWNTINTNIDYLNCNTGGCVLGLDYQINGKTHKKEFSVSKDFVRPSNNQVTITYDTTNPNNSYLGSSNYNIIIYSLYGLGIFFICIWCYLSTDKKSSSYEPSISFYSKSEIPSEIYSIAK